MTVIDILNGIDVVNGIQRFKYPNLKSLSDEGESVLQWLNWDRM